MARFSEKFVPQFVAAFLITIGLTSDGMQYGWSSPTVPILESEHSPVSITVDDIMWLENISSLGAFIGIPFTIWSINHHGRRNSIIVAAILKLIGWILIGSGPSVDILLIGRFLSGFASNAAFVSAPMYIAEIADKDIRGLLLSLVYLLMLLGIIVIYCAGPYVSIPVTCIIGSSVLIFQILTIPFIPQSPYYLLIKKKKDEAKKSLQWFTNNRFIDEELENLAHVVEKQQTEKGRVIDLFTTKSNRRATAIMLYLNGIQHFSGISVMVMNLQTILAKSSSSIDPSIASIAFSIIMLFAAISSSFLVDVVGRKVLLIFSSLVSSISLLSLAIYFTVMDSGINVLQYNWIPVASVVVYAAAFKLGLGMVPIVTTGELFPTNVRALGMTAADASYVVFAFLSISMYQTLAQRFNIQTPLYIYAICAFSSIFVTVFYIPETKGKSLEEIQVLLKGDRLQESYKHQNGYEVLS